LQQEKDVALRIKSRWHDDDAERSLDEIAGALAFIIWRIAKEKAINLHGQDYIFDSDEQRMAVIIEYLIYQLQLVDRLASLRIGLNDDDRRDLVIATAKKLAGHVQDNSVDLFGPGEYIPPFISRLNQRGAEYTDYNYTEDGPSYPFMRHLGYEIQQLMGESQANRWVIDQVMDKDGPEVDRQLRRAIDDLFG